MGIQLLFQKPQKVGTSATATPSCKISIKNANEAANWPSSQRLCKLMESRGTDAVLKLNQEFGGVDGLCSQLRVDQLRGLPNDEIDLSKRRERFGANTIPSTKPKPFWRLLFDAIKDPTLLILIVAGFISLLLSFSGLGQNKSEQTTTLYIDKTSNGFNVSSEPLPNINLNISNSNHSFFTTIPNTSSVPEAPNIEKDEKNESTWVEGVAILVCVVVVCLVTAINDFSKERQFRGLQAKIATGHRFSVIRDGDAVDVPVSELVVGDVARVKYGDLIPADGIIIQSNDLKVDESSLTGESEHVVKCLERDPILLSGTYAMEGSAKMVITAVGMNSQTGIIMSLLGGARPHDHSPSDSSSSSSSSSDDSSSTSSSSASSTSSDSSKDDTDDIHAKSILQTKLSALALQIIYCGTTMAVLALIVLVIRFCLEEYSESGAIFKVEHLQSFVKFVIIAVTILVISIPEGLPLAIALSLTYSVQKMMKDNNLVRHLDACETMGNATTICSDKTGTLTTNRMTVVQSFTCGRYFGDEKSQPGPGQLPSGVSERLSEAIAINCAYNSIIVKPKKAGDRIQQLGNKTECGLLGWVCRIGGNYEQLRIQHPEESLYKVYTFNSTRKMMMTVIRLCENGQPIGYRVFCKGASEILLSRFKFLLNRDGQPELFTEEHREQLMQEVVQRMAESGLRTIAIGYKDFVFASARPTVPTEIQIEKEEEICWDDEQAISADLVGLAICGIQDPVREEVPAAIEKCRRAGITVRMVTGDNVNTARAIAIQCGIFHKDEDFLVLEGKEFNERIRNAKGKVEQKKLDKIWPKLRVLARAQPADKYVLVKGIINSKLNTQREIVAVTGDGTNDGPALKKADVGFAMGIAGTDVAKEASDIILTDDNFTSIVKAVMWGRNVYDSISKFLQFQLTVNIVAVFTAFISACTISDSPLKAVHMLWLNLIMDTLASLALATEMPTDELLQRKPYGRKKSLISRTMIKNIGCHALYQFTILMLLLFKLPDWWKIESGIGKPINYPPTQHFTIVFNAFVMMTLFNEINSRKVHGERNVFKNLLSNRMFCIIWCSTFLAQFLIAQFGGNWFSTKALTEYQWLLCLGLGVSELAFGQLVATIPTKKCLPKWFALYRTVPPESYPDYDKRTMQRQMPQMSRGYVLWMRGIELICLNYRVCRNLHDNLMGRRLGTTAPKMSAETAQQLLESYRQYRHKKHMERRMRATDPDAIVISDGKPEGPETKPKQKRANAVSIEMITSSQQPALAAAATAAAPPRARPTVLHKHRRKSVIGGTYAPTPSPITPSAAPFTGLTSPMEDRRVRRQIKHIMMRSATIDVPESAESGGGTGSSEQTQTQQQQQHRKHHHRHQHSQEQCQPPHQKDGEGGSPPPINMRKSTIS